MARILQASVLAVALIVATAPAALAQTGVLKGKVVDGEGQPVQGAIVVMEFADGINRKNQVKTDRRGEFIQIGLPPGNYRVTATDEKLGSQTFPARVRSGQSQDVNFVLAPGAPGAVPVVDPKIAELKKLFEEGVAASRANDHDTAIERFTAAAAAAPPEHQCYDCYYNVGYAYLQKKDEKQAETAWLKAIEINPAFADALNALATLYNNQKRFDEAGAMSGRAASAGGGSSGSADAIYNQGIILWNQGKIPEAKLKFEEALQANPNHAESHFQLGMALLNEGNVSQAIEAFEAYLKLAPDGQYAAQATSMLATLKQH